MRGQDFGFQTGQQPAAGPNDDSLTYLAAIVQSSDDAIIAKRLDGTVMSWNAAAERLYGYSAQEAVGRNIAIVVPAEGRDDLAALIAQVGRGEAVRHHRAERVRKDGTLVTVSLSISPVRDATGTIVGAATIARDITERQRAEDARRAGKEREDEAQRRQNRELRALSSCHQTLLRAVDEQALLSDICRIVRDEAGYELAWVGYAENDEAKTVRPVAWAGAEEAVVAAVGITWADTDRGRGPTGTAIRSGTTSYIQDLRADPRAAPWREHIAQGGYRASIGLPLSDENGGTFGALSIYSSQPGAFTDDELRLLEGLAADLAFGITVLRGRVELAQADARRRAHVALLENMERIDRAIRRETDVESMLRDVVETVFDVFACDRAWLFYPCDPDAPFFEVPVEVSHPDYPGANVSGPVPMHPSIAEDLRAALAHEGPLCETNGTERPVNTLSVEQFGVQAQMFQAIYPRIGEPWVFGMHQCSHPRTWTEDERDLFREMGRRVADGLGNVLLLRDLRGSQGRLSAAAAEWRATFDAMRDSVALFDAEGRVVRCNAATVELTGRDYDDILGHRCFEVFHGADNWHAACPQVQARDRSRSETAVFEQDDHWLCVSFQPMADGDGRYTGGVHVVTDITGIKLSEQQLQESLGRLLAVTEEVIAAIAAIVEVRDPYTAGHERRVSELAAAIARKMGCGEDEITGMRVSALLHDVGKITVPVEILTKPTALTPMEFALIQTHPQVTHDLLAGIEFTWPVAQAALQHHERLDGSGYPQGLMGDEIVLEARILAVADVVEAMASYRPYRPALGIEAALLEIDKNRGRLYDPAAADACIELFRSRAFAFGQPERGATPP